MAIKYHYDIEQGSAEWHQLRCGILTASEMDSIITPAKLEFAKNGDSRTQLNKLASQKATGFYETTFQTFDMARGKDEEVLAKNYYRDAYGDIVKDVGFITNDKWGFTLGCSPDGLIGDDGIIESKSRKQQFQFETILADAMPIGSNSRARMKRSNASP